AVRRAWAGAGAGSSGGGSRGLGPALDSNDRVGADLAHADHEDPDPLPLLGRVLGDQVRAAARGAGSRERPERRGAVGLAAAATASSAGPARASHADVRA